jgi:hypothetical protein
LILHSSSKHISKTVFRLILRRVLSSRREQHPTTSRLFSTFDVEVLEPSIRTPIPNLNTPQDQRAPHLRHVLFLWFVGPMFLV